MPYHHLTPIERGQIQAMCKNGKRNSEIARELGRDRSTIGRELSRNHVKPASYDAARAQRRYVRERLECRRTRTLSYLPLARYVIDNMMNGWSPEQVAGRLWLDYPGVPRMRVSHETIYRNIYEVERWGKLLLPCLRQRHPRRRARGTRRPARPIIQNRICIEQRPPEVDALTRYGDWEGDTIIGRHQETAIVTMVERKSLLVKAAVLDSRKAAPVASAIISMLEPLPAAWRKTITFDNGTEFAHHQHIAAQIATDIYFAHPYASHERGRNENTNGLLRQYLPKSTSFKNVTQQQLQQILDELNQRPRKTLNYQSPLEVFEKHLCCT